MKVTEDSVPLFVNLEGKRVPLRARNGDFAAGRRSFSLSALSELLAASPLDFSPNALLRPVVQDSLLSTAAYVAGPAEVAYFAQASVYYAALLGRMPVILPRASFTLVNAHTDRLLRKYDLQFSDLLRGPAKLREKMEGTLLPKTLTRRFDRGEKSLQKMLAELREQVTHSIRPSAARWIRPNPRCSFNSRSCRKKSAAPWPCAPLSWTLTSAS